LAFLEAPELGAQEFQERFASAELLRNLKNYKKRYINTKT